MRLFAQAGIPALALLAGSNSAGSTERFDCQPRWPVFCANMHIGCTGPSTRKAHSFTVVLEGSRVRVTFANAEVWAGAIQSTSRDRLIRRTLHRDWIRIESNGHYSLRRYHPRGPLMSIGTCRSRPG